MWRRAAPNPEPTPKIRDDDAHRLRRGPGGACARGRAGRARGPSRRWSLPPASPSPGNGDGSCARRASTASPRSRLLPSPPSPSPSPCPARSCSHCRCRRAGRNRCSLASHPPRLAGRFSGLAYSVLPAWAMVWLRSGSRPWRHGAALSVGRGLDHGFRLLCRRPADRRAEACPENLAAKDLERAYCRDVRARLSSAMLSPSF